MKLIAILLSCIALLAGCDGTPSPYQEENLKILKAAETGDLIICKTPSDELQRAVLVQNNDRDFLFGYRLGPTQINHIDSGVNYKAFRNCKVERIPKGNPKIYEIAGKIILTGLP